MAHARRRARACPQRGKPGHGRRPCHVAAAVRRGRRRRGRGRLPEEHWVSTAAAVGRAAARHGHGVEVRRARPGAAPAAVLWLQLDLQERRPPSGSRGLLERPVVVVQVILVVVSEGAHGARLRADRRVIPGAAPTTPLLSRGLSPPVDGFSDPPRDQGRLVFGPHLCCRTSIVVSKCYLLC